MSRHAVDTRWEKIAAWSPLGIFYLFMAMMLRFCLLGSIEWVGLLGVAVSVLFLATLDVQLHRRTAIVLLINYSNFFLIGICLYRIYQQAARPITHVALACAILVTVRGGGEQAFYAPSYVYLPLTARSRSSSGLRQASVENGWPGRRWFSSE